MTGDPGHGAAGPCVIGIDIGAGSLKATVVDGEGRERACASHAYPTSTPRAGWSEQDPLHWWDAMCRAVPQALARAAVRAQDVRAVSFSAGAHTPVLLDAHDRVLRPAILWSDQRSGREAEELAHGHGPLIQDLTLNRPTATWTLPQLWWLRRHEPEVAARVRRVCIAKDWLRMRLCGQWHTDITDAVGTLMWDHRAARWSPPLCDLIGWDVTTLPPVLAPTAVAGTVMAEAAQACGLAAGTLVVCGTSDTSCESFAAGSNAVGAGVVKLATAATVSVVGDRPAAHDSLINYPFAVPGLWYTITGTNSCASAHRWLRDLFLSESGRELGEDFAAMDAWAGEVAVGADGLLFHPYLQGERAPYWDPRLRADFVGMTMRHGRAHFVRALYEGIAFSLRDLKLVFDANGLAMDEARIVGGGSRSALWRQIVADVLGLRIVWPAVTDASYGAALLAGVAAGLFPDERSAAMHGQHRRAVHEPDAARHARYTELFALYKEAQASLVAVNHQLHDFESATGQGAAS